MREEPVAEQIDADVEQQNDAAGEQTHGNGQDGKLWKCFHIRQAALKELRVDEAGQLQRTGLGVKSERVSDEDMAMAS